MQNMYSPNGFYLAILKVLLNLFDKILILIKKLTFMLLYKYMIFRLFLTDFN